MIPNSLTQKAANDVGLLAKLVMAGTKPGHDENGVIFSRLESA
jgi:hypothetical protein